MAREKSVVARCAVFCNGFAPFVDEWMKKSEVRKKWSRTAYCFLQRFCAIYGRAKREQVHAVLFFTMVFVHLRYPKWTLYCFLQAF